MELKINWQKYYRDCLYEYTKVNEQYEAIENKDLLFEKYCVYDGQYEDAHEISTKVIEMLKDKVYHYEGDWAFKNIEMASKLNINISIEKGQTYSASVDFKDGTVFLEVCLLPIFRDVSLIDEDALYTRVESSITHELQHLNIVDKMKIDNDYKWYQALVSIITNEPSMTYSTELFIRGLYLSYYHERQAYASEVSKEIEWLIKNDKVKNNLSKDDLIKYLKKTNPYKAYLTSLNYMPYLKTLAPYEREEIAGMFSKYDKEVGVDILQHYKKYMNMMERGLEKGMKKIMQNFNYILQEKNLI